MSIATHDTNETTPESLDSMIARHRNEIRAAIEAQQTQAREVERSAQAAVRSDAAEALRDALAQVEKQIARSDADDLYVAAMYGGLPPQFSEYVRQAARRAADGERVAVVMIPKPDRYGYVERKAFALIDVSDAVWR